MQDFSYLGCDRQPVLAIRQIVIRENHVRAESTPSEQRKRGGSILRCRRSVAFCREDHIEELAHFAVVLDHQDRAGAAGIARHREFRDWRRLAFRERRAGWQHHVDGKNGTFAGLRADMDGMTEQGRQPLNDG